MDFFLILFILTDVFFLDFKLCFLQAIVAVITCHCCWYIFFVFLSCTRDPLSRQKMATRYASQTRKECHICNFSFAAHYLNCRSGRKYPYRSIYFHSGNKKYFKVHFRKNERKWRDFLALSLSPILRGACKLWLGFVLNICVWQFFQCLFSLLQLHFWLFSGAKN